jgi:integrase
LFDVICTPYLFPNAEGQHLKIRSVTRKIRRLRKKAGLDTSVTFDRIRDLFRRAAGTENFVAIKWAMGHSLGIDDVYGFRDARETEATMAKVESYVFGGK